MATIQRFEDLEVWQKPRFFAKSIFQLSNNGLLAKDYTLKDQINRSSGSIMDNIAEGFDRGSRFEFINSLSISKGETGELKSQLYRSLDNTYISEVVFKELYEDVDVLTKKTTNFIKYLNSTKFKGQKFKNRDRK